MGTFYASYIPTTVLGNPTFNSAQTSAQAVFIFSESSSVWSSKEMENSTSTAKVASG